MNKDGIIMDNWEVEYESLRKNQPEHYSESNLFGSMAFKGGDPLCALKVITKIWENKKIVACYGAAPMDATIPESERVMLIKYSDYLALKFGNESWSAADLFVPLRLLANNVYTGPEDPALIKYVVDYFEARKVN